MRLLTLLLAATLPLWAVPAGAAEIFIEKIGTSNAFTGDGTQSVALGQAEILGPTSTLEISAPGALSYQFVSVADPSLYGSLPAGTSYQGPPLASGDYYINAVYDPTLFTPGLVTDLPFSLSVGRVPASGVAKVLRELHAITPIGLAVLGTGGQKLDVALLPADLAATFVTAVVDWGDGKTTATVLPVINGLVDVVANQHDYTTPGSYAVALSFVLNGSSFSANGLLDVTDVPEPAALWFAPLALATVMLRRRVRAV